MLASSIHELLLKLHQQQLLIGLESLSSEELHDFSLQLQKYSPLLSAEQKKGNTHLSPQPYLKHERSGDQKRGEMLIGQGKVGCLILAGGQGTRLGFDGPKGCFPVTPMTRKSLFQLFCERTKGASIGSGHPLPYMYHDLPIEPCADYEEFLQKSGYFGLASSQISHFYSTRNAPTLLDDRGQWLLEKPGKIAEGPDGNGHALKLFFTSGIWEKWESFRDRISQCDFCR